MPVYIQDTTWYCSPAEEGGAFVNLVARGEIATSPHLQNFLLLQQVQTEENPPNKATILPNQAPPEPCHCL